MQKTLILFLTHFWSPALGERFLRLQRESRDFGECRVLLHDDHGPVRRAWQDLLDEAGIPEGLEPFEPQQLEAELGYTMLRKGSLTPGSAHFPLLELMRHSDCTHYWLVEFDVECSRPWQEFFGAFEHGDADLLASHVYSRAQRPDWFWWESLLWPADAGVPVTGQWKAFLPICRISRRALEAVDAAHRAGWRGHCEVLLPTVLRGAGLDLRDLREFSPCYTGTEQDPHEDRSILSSMRFRPEISLQELAVRTAVPRLLHPVKSGISVVMATCNGTRFLRDQLDSIERQTRRPDELVIVDDCSSDGTRDLLRRFARRSKLNVRLFEQESRVGYSANFLGGLSLTVGDLVLFCDQDDLWHPDKIKLIEATAADSDKALFSHDIEIMPYRRKPAIASMHQHLRRLGLGPSACIKGHSLAVRRSFVLQWGPPPVALFSHDLWFALLATLVDQRTCLPDILVRHRLHARNVSGWIPALSDLCALIPEELSGPVTPAEILMDLCIKGHVDERLAVLEQVLEARLHESQPEVLRGALGAIGRHRSRMSARRSEAMHAHQPTDDSSGV